MYVSHDNEFGFVDIKQCDDITNHLPMRQPAALSWVLYSPPYSILSLGQGAKRLIQNLLSSSNENMNEHVSPMQNHLPPDDMTAALSWLGLVLYILSIRPQSDTPYYNTNSSSLIFYWTSEYNIRTSSSWINSVHAPQTS